MKKIIIWGTGKGCRSYTVLFKTLEKRGDIKVIAHYLDSDYDSEWNIVRDINELREMNYDYYVIGTNRPEMDATKAEVLALGVPQDRILSLSACILELERIPEVHDKIVDNQIEAI